MPETRTHEYLAPGAPATPEILRRLRATWMETYMALQILRSVSDSELLAEMKLKLGLANEAVMAFFDAEGVGD